MGYEGVASALLAMLIVAPAALAPAAGPSACAAATTRRAPASSLAWVDRIALERAAAEGEPRYAPRVTDGGTVLESTASARVDRDGATITIGDARVAIRLAAMGRGHASDFTFGSTSEVVGAEVRVRRAPGTFEWWRALPSGLEHGVTIERRPGGDGALVLEIEVDGELRPRGKSDDAIALVDERAQEVASYAHLVVADAAGALMPARMSVVEGRVRIEIEDAHAAYPLVVDPLIAVEEATLASPDGAASDNFGAALALSADGVRAIVGAYHDDTPAGSDAGAAHVFLRSGATWAHEAALRASDAAAGDQFGCSVAMSSDGMRAIVGACSDDTAAGTGAGTARVFVRTGSTWAEEATLRASDAATFDGFGYSVSLNADATLALVGSPDDDTSAGANAGSARVFARTGATWTEQATLAASDGAAGDWLGSWVSLSADGSRALVGAEGDDVTGGADAGSARVFARAATTWTEEATLTAFEGGGGDHFGVSVALSGDSTRAIVGAVNDDTDAGVDAGSAWVFVRSGVTWSREVMLVAPDGATGDRFGLAVGLSADGSSALVGAWHDETSAGGSAGSARLFTRSGMTWLASVPLTSSGASAGDLFGVAVALSADGTRAVVGAQGDDTARGENAGTARAFTIGLANGDACSLPAECATRACVDGVCCESACGGGATDDCQACSATLTGLPQGTCGAVVPSAGITCRPAAGACDVAEACTGTTLVCPADTFVAARTECRPSTGPCDAAESCTGTGASCPADRLAAAGAVCRDAAAPCDAAETCSGSDATCPEDVLAAAGAECRAAAGPCDVAESCSGADLACPDDSIAAGTTTCGGVCLDGVAIVAATCDGASIACPGSTTTCAPYACGERECRSSCATAADCAPLHACDGSGACVPDRIESDAGADSGVMDASSGLPDAGGPEVSVSAGCGCRAAGGGSDTRASLVLVLSLLAFGLLERRHRGRPPRHRDRSRARRATT